MPFEDSAREEVQRLPQGDSTRMVLEYLLEEGLGHENAKSWEQINARLQQQGVTNMDKEKFQQRILARTREGNVFIGSSDSGAARGYFIIRNRRDAQVTEEFYVRRLRSQTTNLERLRGLMAEAWPR